MDLVKDNLRMNRIKCKNTVQMTVDNDINVPDIRPDISRIICTNGDISIGDVKPGNGRIMLKGRLAFHILYESNENTNCIAHMEGDIAFDESVNMNDIDSEDKVNIRWEIEGLKADIINSRKVSVKAIVKLILSVCEPQEIEMVIDTEDDFNIEKKYSDELVSELVVNNRDIIRVRDEALLPSGKDCIGEIIYKEAQTEDINVTMEEDSINVSGTLKIFILYRGLLEDGINDYEAKISFSQPVQVLGCRMDMIPYIIPVLNEWNILVKSDEDNEERIIDIEAVYGLDIKIYEEKKIHYLDDMYSTKFEVMPEYKDAVFENVAMRNNSLIRVNDRLNITAEGSPILQICNAYGNVKIDEEKRVDAGIEVSGIIEISVLYYTAKEQCQIDAYTDAIPFSYIIEASGMNEDSIYELSTSLKSIGVNVTGANEIEVKANVGNDVIVFNRMKKKIICDCLTEERQMQDDADAPGIIGYIAKPQDTVWSIAKAFKTTVKRIQDINGVNEITGGEKILIIKQM